MLRSIAVVCCVVVGSSAKAGPDDLSKWLMNEPASMMDIGLLRLEIYLDKVRIEDREYGVVYIWDRDRILIRSTPKRFDDPSYKDEDDAKKGCKNWFNRMRYEFGVNGATGELREGDLFLSSFFGHDGFTRGKQTDPDFHVQIGKKIDLWGSFDFGDKSDRSFVYCSKPLMDTGFSVEVRE